MKLDTPTAIGVGVLAVSLLSILGNQPQQVPQTPYQPRTQWVPATKTDGDEPPPEDKPKRVYH